MGKTSKRKKADGIQFSIGKRIKVQAQRKFAQGAAILPMQTPKEPSTTQPVNNDLYRNQQRKINFVVPTAPKVYTEDFLTFLCFKGSPSLPAHLRSGSFLQPQTIYPSHPILSSANLQSRSVTSQPLPQVQGFIPFGVRKQASQYPKKVISKKHLQKVKKFTKQKPARYTQMESKGSKNNKKKILTRGATKTITKKKQKIIPATATYTIATRRQTVQQKTLRKNISVLDNSQSLQKNVSLRNRVVNITSTNAPEKTKVSDIVKKKVDKVPIKTETCVSKTEIEKTKKDNKQSVTSSNADIETLKTSTITTRMKSIQMKNNEKQVLSQTRSGAVRQLNAKIVPTVQKVTCKVEKETKTPLKQKISTTARKNVHPIDKFDFSSDDDEPLYKKLTKTKSANASGLNTPKKLPETESNGNQTPRLTRSTLKEIPDSKDDNKTAVTKTPNKIAITITSRVTRQNLCRNKYTTPIAIKQTRSKNVAKNIQTLKKLNEQSTKITKKTVSGVDKKVTKNTQQTLKACKNPKKEENETVQKNKDDNEINKKILNDSENTSENWTIENVQKNFKIDCTTDLIPKERKLEKSFSESDDEPLATKLCETLDRKMKRRKGSKDKVVGNLLSPIVALKNDSHTIQISSEVRRASVGLKGMLNDTNPIPSYEESLKIFGIAHGNIAAKTSKILNPIKKSSQKEMLIDRKHDFQSTYDNSQLVKNDTKNRQSRKFVKSKEYIEQWLQNSARPFADCPASTSICQANLFNKRVINIEFEHDNEELMTPKSNLFLPNEKLSSLLKPSINSNSESLLKDVTLPEKKIPPTNNPIENTKEKNDIKYQVELPSEGSLNVYEFDSESEMITSLPRKSKFKDSFKKTDKNTSLFGLYKKNYSYGFGENSKSQDITTENLANTKENPVLTTDNFIVSTQKSNTGHDIKLYEKSSPDLLGNVISDAIIASLNPNDDVTSHSHQDSFENFDDKLFMNTKSNGSQNLIDVSKADNRKYTQNFEVQNKGMGRNDAFEFTKTNSNQQKKHRLSKGSLPDFEADAKQDNDFEMAKKANHDDEPIVVMDFTQPRKNFTSGRKSSIKKPELDNLQHDSMLDDENMINVNLIPKDENCMSSLNLLMSKKDFITVITKNDVAVDVNLPEEYPNDQKPKQSVPLDDKNFLPVNNEKANMLSTINESILYNNPSEIATKTENIIMYSQQKEFVEMPDFLKNPNKMDTTSQIQNNVAFNNLINYNKVLTSIPSIVLCGQQKIVECNTFIKKDNLISNIDPNSSLGSATTKLYFNTPNMERPLPQNSGFISTLAPTQNVMNDGLNTSMNFNPVNNYNISAKLIQPSINQDQMPNINLYSNNPDQMKNVNLYTDPQIMNKFWNMDGNSKPNNIQYIPLKQIGQQASVPYDNFAKPFDANQNQNDVNTKYSDQMYFVNPMPTVQKDVNLNMMDKYNTPTCSSTLSNYFDIRKMPEQSHFQTTDFKQMPFNNDNANALKNMPQMNILNPMHASMLNFDSQNMSLIENKNQNISNSCMANVYISNVNNEVMYNPDLTSADKNNAKQFMTANIEMPKQMENKINEFIPCDKMELSFSNVTSNIKLYPGPSEICPPKPFEKKYFLCDQQSLLTDIKQQQQLNTGMLEHKVYMNLTGSNKNLNQDQGSHVDNTSFDNANKLPFGQYQCGSYNMPPKYGDFLQSESLNKTLYDVNEQFVKQPQALYTNMGNFLHQKPDLNNMNMGKMTNLYAFTTSQPMMIKPMDSGSFNKSMDTGSNEPGIKPLVSNYGNFLTNFKNVTNSNTLENILSGNSNFNTNLKPQLTPMNSVSELNLAASNIKQPFFTKNPILKKDASSNTSSSDLIKQMSECFMKSNATQILKRSESEDHLFYIPLEGHSESGVDMSNHLIEGVAVKMESQGPDGPEQRVIMRAKLVRKSQINNMPSNVTKQTAPMLDMVRSVREAFPDATIHSEPITDISQVIGECSQKSNPTPPPDKKSQVNLKNKTQNMPTTSQKISSTSSTCSSQSSSSFPRRNCGRSTERVDTINHKNNTSFPQIEDPAQMVEAPVFQPSEKEFQDPLEFIEKISPVAARYGLCRIIPPASFRPECKISDDMRFTPHNQYLQRMLYRWGPSSREMCAIKKYLGTQSVAFKQPPTLSGIEVDLPKLYHVVQNMGGLNKVLEKKMWHKIAEEMCLPLHVHYMDIRLDEIYCKYLLPYDTLSNDERKKLFESVDEEWEKRQQRMMSRATNPLNLMSPPESDNADDVEYDNTEDIEECITRGKSMTLNSFSRAAKNTMTMQFGKVRPPTPEEVESKFWDYVTNRDSHVCVSTGSIDSSVWGYGFPNVKTKNSPIAKHPWNLKVLTNNNGSVLRSLGPIMGVTVPTIHVGMIFSTCCWYRDPHGLPWIEYLHEGAPKIWYGVPDSQSVKFKETLSSIVPSYCQKKTIWLLSDTTMVPPTMLADHGVSLCRTIQRPGEFILVFPKAFTSSICTGYNVSESVYFALSSWLDTAHQDFIDIRNSCEPSMFSLERLIVAISEDVRTPYHVLKKVLPTLNKIIQTEKQHREILFNIGLKASEKAQSVMIGKKKVAKQQDEVEECHRCRTSLSLSMLYNDADGSVFCLPHAAEFLSTNKNQIDECKLIYMHSIDELERLLSKLIERINMLANKKCSKAK